MHVAPLKVLDLNNHTVFLQCFPNLRRPSVTVDKSVREEDRSDDKEKDENVKDIICQLFEPKDSILVQRQVLRALTLEV